MSELVRFAKAELRAAGLFDADADYDGAVAANVVALMETYTAYGHSGESGRIALALFVKLAQHKPITPLTGEADEWQAMPSDDDGPLFQNKRCYTVFKRDGVVAWDTANHNRAVTFPYGIE